MYIFVIKIFQSNNPSLILTKNTIERKTQIHQVSSNHHLLTAHVVYIVEYPPRKLIRLDTSRKQSECH